MAGQGSPSQLYGDIAPAKYLLGMLNYADHPELFSLQTQPPAQNPSNTDNRWLRTEVNQALAAMYAAFRSDYPDVAWSFVSGGRNYSYQSQIWNNKWDACGVNISTSQPLTCCLNILEYSSMPGTSRHHCTAFRFSFLHSFLYF
ncbi:MAG: D-alanyl-D-alanine carboxypeptidase family protein [archaeon]|nr:D-alanyl-D-alanine carboxypeptidase family protein [archaeon]